MMTDMDDIFEKIWQRCAELNPEDVVASHGRSLLLYSRRDYRGSSDEYEKHLVNVAALAVAAIQSARRKKAAEPGKHGGGRKRGVT